MKRIISIALLSLITAISGCKTIPSQESVTLISKGIGAAAAVACNLNEVDQSTFVAITQIVSTVRMTIPSEDSTYALVWDPIIQKELNKIYDDGKLTDDQFHTCNKITKMITVGIDYLYSKHEVWKTYNDLSICVIDGFCEGFVSVFNKVINDKKNSVRQPLVFDYQAYKYFRSVQQK